MTLEEAIKYAESKKIMLESLIFREDCAYGNYAMYSNELSFVNAALTALRPVSREQVENVWRGEWDSNSPRDIVVYCKQCMMPQDIDTNFCHSCGAAMTDEAVEMVMERLEALHEDNGCS